jgi:hypothetical protein
MKTTMIAKTINSARLLTVAELPLPAFGLFTILNIAVPAGKEDWFKISVGESFHIRGYQCLRIALELNLPSHRQAGDFSHCTLSRKEQ